MIVIRSIYRRRTESGAEPKIIDIYRKKNYDDDDDDDDDDGDNNININIQIHLQTY